VGAAVSSHTALLLAVDALPLDERTSEESGGWSVP
jgi:hypothetical protein